MVDLPVSCCTEVRHLECSMPSNFTCPFEIESQQSQGHDGPPPSPRRAATPAVQPPSTRRAVSDSDHGSASASTAQALPNPSLERTPPARHLGREAIQLILRHAAQAPRRWCPLSSNVRQTQSTRWSTCPFRVALRYAIWMRQSSSCTCGSSSQSKVRVTRPAAEPRQCSHPAATTRHASGGSPRNVFAPASQPRRCLTLRSSGPPPAWRLARQAMQSIIRLAGQAPHRRGPLSSNVMQTQQAPAPPPQRFEQCDD